MAVYHTTEYLLTVSIPMYMCIHARARTHALTQSSTVLSEIKVLYPRREISGSQSVCDKHSNRLRCCAVSTGEQSRNASA